MVQFWDLTLAITPQRISLIRGNKNPNRHHISHVPHHKFRVASMRWCRIRTMAMP